MILTFTTEDIRKTILEKVISTTRLADLTLDAVELKCATCFSTEIAAEVDISPKGESK
jgi:hypothetical protein